LRFFLKRKNSVVGQIGEELASKYLSDLDFTILDRNYRCLHGEIDIIAIKNKVLHFIEVKTRKTTHYGHPVEAYTLSKQKKIVKTAWTYLDGKFLSVKSQPAFQFDLITLLLNDVNEATEIRYYEHAITMDLW